MGTRRLTAIWRIIRSDQSLTITQRGTEFDTIGSGQGELSDVIAMTVTLKRLYEEMTKMINEAASEVGELHAAEEIRKSIDILEKK